MITLISNDQAKEGYEFIPFGQAEECADCSLRLSCNENLEVGRKYRVKLVKEKSHPCKMGGEVVLVDVEEAEVMGVMEKKKAYHGSKIEFFPMECTDIFCVNYKYCRPDGLRSGDTCQIIDSFDPVDCKLMDGLVRVKLKRIE